jgi:hypothetical protein
MQITLSHWIGPTYVVVPAALIHQRVVSAIEMLGLQSVYTGSLIAQVVVSDALMYQEWASALEMPGHKLHYLNGSTLRM